MWNFALQGGGLPSRRGVLLVLQKVRALNGGPQGVIHDTGPKLNGWKIIREMVRHIWPRDKPWLKVRVVSALGLLIGAKVR